MKFAAVIFAFCVLLQQAWADFTHTHGINGLALGNGLIDPSFGLGFGGLGFGSRFGGFR